MDRIYDQNDEDKSLAITVLKWVTYAKRHLRVAELQHAAVFKPENTDVVDGDLIEVDDLVSLCGGIVTVDRENDIVRPVHYTAQLYLQRRFQLVDTYTYIPETCLAYFGLDIFSKPCEDEESIKQLFKKYSLTPYAAEYWAEHVCGNQEKHFEVAILKRFQEQGRRDSLYQNKVYALYGMFSEPPISLSLLHFVSIYGLSTTCNAILGGTTQHEDWYVVL